MSQGEIKGQGADLAKHKTGNFLMLHYVKAANSYIVPLVLYFRLLRKHKKFSYSPAVSKTI